MLPSNGVGTVQRCRRKKQFVFASICVTQSCFHTGLTRNDQRPSTTPPSGVRHHSEKRWDSAKPSTIWDAPRSNDTNEAIHISCAHQRRRKWAIRVCRAGRGVDSPAKQVDWLYGNSLWASRYHGSINRFGRYQRSLTTNTLLSLPYFPGSPGIMHSVAITQVSFGLTSVMPKLPTAAPRSGTRIRSEARMTTSFSGSTRAMNSGARWRKT